MEHILSLSYGKDSLACLGAIEELGWPLDRIIHAEVWATDAIPADLPPMVEFKAKADALIKERWGIEVEHICAMRNGEKLTYEKLFYHVPKRKPGGKFSASSPAGFPYTKGAWCNDRLKTTVLDQIAGGERTHGLPYQAGSNNMLAVNPRLSNDQRQLVCKAASNARVSQGAPAQGAKKSIVQYLGIAADEPERIQRHRKPGYKMPLVETGWTEAYCRKWCMENDLLSPTYTTASRGGCWFCHNQGIDQLRLLRKNYPDYWALLLKWDTDSPVSFKPDGHTIHDYDRRFRAEDSGKIVLTKRFRWADLDREDE